MTAIREYRIKKGISQAQLAAFVIILLAIVDLLFDKITGAMARHWVKTGKQPARRWAEIIARGRCDEEQ